MKKLLPFIGLIALFITALFSMDAVHVIPTNTIVRGWLYVKDSIMASKYIGISSSPKSDSLYNEGAYRYGNSFLRSDTNDLWAADSDTIWFDKEPASALVYIKRPSTRNYGLDVEAKDYAVYGDADNNFGVYGCSDSSYGVFGCATYNYGGFFKAANKPLGAYLTTGTYGNIIAEFGNCTGYPGTINAKAFIDSEGVYKFYSFNARFGGRLNVITGSNYGVIIGGQTDSIINSGYSAILAGRLNAITNAGSYNAIIGGVFNTVKNTSINCFMSAADTTSIEASNLSVAIGIHKGNITGSVGSIIAGNQTRCDTSDYSFAMNCYLRQADSTFAFSKQGWFLEESDTTIITATYVETDSFIGEIDTTGTKFQAYVSNHAGGGGTKYFDTLYLYGGADTNATYIKGDTQFTVYQSSFKNEQVDGLIYGKSNIVGLSTQLYLFGNNNYVDYSTYSGIFVGENDTITSSTTENHNVILGGKHCRIYTGSQSIISGGIDNYINNDNCGIFSGYQDSIKGYYRNVIVGGEKNEMQNGVRSGIFAGTDNSITGTNNCESSVILGGEGNNFYNNVGRSAIVAGLDNKIEVNTGNCGILGGYLNYITSSSYSGIIGGFKDTIKSSEGSVILGGESGSIVGDETHKYNIASSANIDTCLRCFAMNTSLRQADSTFAFSKQMWVMQGNDTTILTSTYVRSYELLRDTVWLDSVLVVDTIVDARFTSTATIDLVWLEDPNCQWWITNATADTVFVHTDRVEPSTYIKFRWWIIKL
ncbi:MAG: hypothetical protein B5M53_05555 [Candidatus Cloacimonas sp. 4484_209]|nr:MAG: hypothetical protein B5M53_05555 [Candidatus Cloacimonas sp. 4484_209]